MHSGTFNQRFRVSIMFTGLKRLQMTTSNFSRRQNLYSSHIARRRMPFRDLSENSKYTERSARLTGSPGAGLPRRNAAVIS